MSETYPLRAKPNNKALARMLAGISVRITLHGARISPREALAVAAQKCVAADRYGRESQKKLYAESYGEL